MTENGIARSRPPQYQLLGGGGLLFIGLVFLWLGCRRWVAPSFSDDDAGVATRWLACAIIIITLGSGVISFEYITSYSYNYSLNRQQTCNLVIHSFDQRKIKFSPKDYIGEHVTSVIAFRLRKNRWPSLWDEFDQLAVMEAAANGSGESYLRSFNSAILSVT